MQFEYLITKFSLSSITEQSGILHAVITGEFESDDTYCLYFFWSLDGACQVDKFFKNYDSGSYIAVTDITGGEWQAAFDYSEETEAMTEAVDVPEWTSDDQAALKAIVEASKMILSVQETEEDGSYRVINSEVYNTSKTLLAYQGPYEWDNQELAEESVCSKGFDDEWIKDISSILQVL